MAVDNRTYLNRIWHKEIISFALLFIVLCAVAIAVAFGKIPWGFLLIFIPVILAGGLTMRRVKSDIARIIRMETPDEWVSFVRRNTWGFTDADAFAAYGCGIAYAYHGRFDDAYAQLHSVKWSERAPLVAAAGVSLESMLEHLKNENYCRGADLAQHAYSMVIDMPMHVPGVKQALSAYETWASIGEVLCGRATPDVLHTLEQNLPKMELLMRPFAAWALAVWYQRQGDRSASEGWLRLARSIVPHCKPLTQMPPALATK